MQAGKNEGQMTVDHELDFDEQDDLLLDELDLPEDGSFILDEPPTTTAGNEQALAGMPEPPSLDDLDIEVAQGSALRSGNTNEDSLIHESPAAANGRPWEDEILSSEELPAEEPEIEEIDSLLGSADSPESGDLATGATELEPADTRISDLPDEIIADDTPDLLDAELDDLEIQESDEAIPPAAQKDITSPKITLENKGEVSATALDNEGLPDITEDEDALDLDEDEFDLLQPETETAAAAALAQQDNEAIYEREMEGAPSSEDFFAESDDDEILLSDEELEDITSEAPAEKAPQADDFFSDDSEEEIALSEEELDGILEDAVPETAAAPVEEAHVTETSPAADEFFSDHDNDEPVSLSADELDGIMEDAVVEEPALENNIPPAAKEITDDFFSEDDDNEPITLSSDELDGIMEDAAEETAATESTEMLLEDIDHTPAIEVEEEPLATEQNQEIPLSPVFEEDEEDITLSAEELNGILEDADIPEVGEDSFQVQESELADNLANNPEEEMNLAPPADSSDFFKEEDEGPITLSDEELDGILAHSGVEPEESVAVEPLPETGISSFENPSPVESILKDDSEAMVLTENLDNASLDSADTRAAAIEKMSEGPMPPREELRKMIAYLDNLLGELPDETIAKFAQSEYFKLYQKVMEQLDL